MEQKRFLFLILIFLLVVLASFHRLSAQESPIKWGEIPRTDLEMKSFPGDTNASVLILCDYGESSIDQDYNLIFSRHTRIKILTTKGYEWGNQSIELYTKKDNEGMQEIKGFIYFLDDHNEVVRKNIEKKDVFEEKVDEDHTRYRFSFPSLKVGCVIEYRYKIIIQNYWLIPDWFFQYSEPVRWSEYIIHSPQTIGFMTVVKKNQPFEIRENVDEKCRYSNKSSLSYGEDGKQCYMIRLAMKDVPALRDEPFITTMNDYRSKVDVQYSGWASLRTGVRTAMTTWPELVEGLLKNDYFGDRIDDTRKVRNQTNAVIAGLTTSVQKMAAIYRWVSSNILWSRKNSIWADREVNDVLESKTGSDAEINFLLLSMFKSAGINGEPVILSTRDNGKIQDTYPIVSQFNYVLARVIIDSQEFLLDATDPLRPMELLPTNVLNVKGLVVDNDSMKWITLATQKQNIVATAAALKIHEDGSLSGNIDDSYSDYGGLFVRQSLQAKKDVEIAEEKFNAATSGMSIDSLLIEGKDSINQELRIHSFISSKSYALKNGKLIYFNPQIIHRVSDNPLKTIERKFPVDYSYGSNVISTIDIAIPDSFKVLEQISDQSMSYAGDAAVFTRKVTINGQQIHIVSKFEIRKSEIKAEYYTELREFYTRVVAAESEQFILSHIENVPPHPDVNSSKIKSNPKQKGTKKARN